MINLTDSLQVDSLKSIVEICRRQQDSLNSIIKANTSVLDINTANNKFALDSLTNHIQICQSQIDSIYAHGDPLHHLSSVFHKLKDWLPSNILDMFQMDNFNKIVTLLAVGIFLFVAIKYHFLKKNPGRYKEKRNEWDEHFMCKPKNRNGKKKDDEIEVPTVWDIFCSLIKFIIKILKGVIRFFKELPERLIFFLSKIKEYLKNTIKFDREILSEDGHSLVRFSLNLAVLFPIVIMLLVIPLGLVWQLLHGGKYSLALGIYDETHAGETNVLWSIISQYLDPGNLANSNGLGSVIAFVLATAGIVCLSGLLVSSIVNWISQRRERWQKGLITYEKVKDFDKYVVIIGINEQTASIARRALEIGDDKNRNGRYVLIQTRQDVEKVRPELESKIDDNIQDRIVYYAGDRTSYEDIVKLHLEKAIEVYILGESVENSDKKNIDEQLEKEHDAYNISCLEHIAEYIKHHVKEEEKKNKPRLNVHVQFDYQSTFTAFKATHLYQKLGRSIRFIPFNIHELWAKKVLVDNLAIHPAGNKTELKVQRYNPIDTYIDKGGERIKVDDEKTVHLIIIGMNQMGTALATQAALLCHFPNFARDKSKKTVITFIDDNAIREAEYYMGRYSTLFELSEYKLLMPGGGDELFNPEEQISIQNRDVSKSNKQSFKHLTEESDNGCLLDVEWEFIMGNAASKAVQKHILKILDDKNKIVTIAICFNDSQQSLASAMYLPKTIYDNCNQVLVYQKSIFDVANDVARGDSDWRRYRNLFPFGMSEASYTENPFDSHLAALDYYLYKNEERQTQIEDYFNPNTDEKKKEKKEFESSFLRSVDDAWENAGIVRKTASIDSVDSIPFKLRSMGIEYCRNIDGIEKIIENKELLNELAETEHNRWMMQRLISGFRHLSVTEQGEIYAEVKEPTKYKRLIEEKKEKERASYYICSWKRMSKLEENDVKDGMASNDKSVIELIPYLLRGQELLNVLILRSQDNRYENSQHKKALKEIFDGNFLLIEGKKEEGKKDEDKVFCEHAFWMADTAVSNKQWHYVTGKKVIGYEEKKELPVVDVSWNDVQDFLDILRKKSGLYFDLPSQKEWRTAADKEEQDKKSWNVRTEDSGEISAPVEVRIKEKSNVLHHFYGNVWEWSRSQDDHGLYKFMGGSFRFKEQECKPDTNEINDRINHYWWHSWEADSKSDDLGFRLVWKYDHSLSFADENTKKGNGPEPQKNEKVEAIKKWFEGEKHKFVKVGSGFFVMGADGTEKGVREDEKPDANEGPRHTVHISEAFYMCKVPVTQSLWNAVKEIKKTRLNDTKNRIGDEIPQTDISWKDVCDFIETLNKEKVTILQTIFPEPPENSSVYEYEFRLPTEAEWEYAAKGGHKAKEPYAIYAAIDDKKKAEDVAWFDQPSIHEVAQKEPNALDLYDMSGNVWEWCHDYYIADMYPACINSTNKKVQNKYIEGEYGKKRYITDPVALDDSYSAHVFRGGSWRSSKWDCRCTRANYWGENYKANDLGFRLVLGRPINQLGEVAEDIRTNIVNANTSNKQ